MIELLVVCEQEA
jgi:hypothetical protein